MEETEQKSEWNIDDAILKAIYALKIKFLTHMELWQLEKAYFTLVAINSEIYPAFKEKDQETLDEHFGTLENARNLLNKKNQGDFYLLLNNVYMGMNQLMIEAGWYFRRKELYMGL